MLFSTAKSARIRVDCLKLSISIIKENHSIVQQCQYLKEYSYFISVVRTYLEKGLELNDAIIQAVKICIDKNVMKEFLEKNSSEVINMLFTEFDMNTAKRNLEKRKQEKKVEKKDLQRRDKKQIEIAKNLLAILDIKDVNMISKATGLSIEEIKKLM